MPQLPRDRPVSALVIDDSLSDVHLLRNAIESSGFRVDLDVIHDGEIALDVLRNHHEDDSWPDLIFLDLSLPKIDGFEILTELKQDERLKSIPVIIMSSSGAERDVRRAYALGANVYLVKPVSLNDLLALVQSLGQFWFKTARLAGIQKVVSTHDPFGTKAFTK